MLRVGRRDMLAGKWCTAAKTLTIIQQVVSVQAVAGFRREKHCKIGRSHPGRRRHKRFRNIPWDAAVPAFLPDSSLGRTRHTLSASKKFCSTRHACEPGVIIFA
jgi:hypothetical protein